MGFHPKLTGSFMAQENTTTRATINFALRHQNNATAVGIAYVSQKDMIITILDGAHPFLGSEHSEEDVSIVSG